MPADFDAALAELYQAPHGSFVDERKRLAADLKAAGDKAGATALAKRTRPTISAWVVNQLWWHARDAFSALMAGAARLREGDLAATPVHRDALAKLRLRAAAILDDAGHGATESTLRRVAQTLSAIAATGTWEPDAPGTLAADRDPPGFDAALLAPTIAGEGAEAAQRVVALTEQAKRNAARVVAEAAAARAGSDEAAATPAVPSAAASSHAVTPEGKRSVTPEGTERSATRSAIPERARSVTPEGTERSAQQSATPEGARSVTPEPSVTPEGTSTRTSEDVSLERVRAARAELASREREVEELRVRLADAKTAAAEARRLLEQLESLLDDA